MKDYALIIGINRYKSDFGDLQGPLRDARNFKRWVTEHGGVENDDKHCKLLEFWVDDDSDQVTRNRVQEIVQAWCSAAKQGPIGGRCWVFFSGHGLATRKAHERDIALMMSDASLGLPDRNVTIKTLEAYLLHHGVFKELITIVDCCRDIATSPPEAQEVGAMPGEGDGVQLFEWVRALPTRIYATTKEEYLPDPFDGLTSYKQGRFTWALLSHLVEAAENNQQVETQSLAQRVRAKLESRFSEDITFVPSEFERNANLTWLESDGAVPTTNASHLEVSAPAGALSAAVSNNAISVELLVKNGQLSAILPAGLYEIQFKDDQGADLGDPVHKRLA